MLPVVISVQVRLLFTAPVCSYRTMRPEAPAIIRHELNLFSWLVGIISVLAGTFHGVRSNQGILSILWLDGWNNRLHCRWTSSSILSPQDAGASDIPYQDNHPVYWNRNNAWAAIHSFGSRLRHQFLVSRPMLANRMNHFSTARTMDYTSPTQHFPFDFIVSKGRKNASALYSFNAFYLIQPTVTGKLKPMWVEQRLQDHQMVHVLHVNRRVQHITGLSMPISSRIASSFSTIISYTLSTVLLAFSVVPPRELLSMRSTAIRCSCMGFPEAVIIEHDMTNLHIHWYP